MSEGERHFDAVAAHRELISRGERTDLLGFLVNVADAVLFLINENAGPASRLREDDWGKPVGKEVAGCFETPVKGCECAARIERLEAALRIYAGWLQDGPHTTMDTDQKITGRAVRAVNS